LIFFFALNDLKEAFRVTLDFDMVHKRDVHIDSFTVTYTYMHVCVHVSRT